MDILPTLKKIVSRIQGDQRPKLAQPNLRQPLLAVEWDKAEVRYVVAVQRKEELQIIHAAHLARQGDADPLLQLKEHLASHSLSVSQLILILSRTDLELMTLTLPAVEEDEIPVLIQAEVEQKLGDSEHRPVFDFVLPKSSSSGPGEVLVFSQSEAQFDSWRSKSQAAGLKLVALTSRHLAPLSILQDAKRLVRPRSVIVTAFAGEIELVVCYQNQPHFVRSIRMGSDEPDGMAEQIAMEIQRSLALEPQTDSQQPLDIFLFGLDEDPPALLESLRNRKIGEIQLYDATLGWSDQRSDKSLRLAGDAAPIGALQGIFRKTSAIDLVSPKRPPTPVSPYRRWGLIGGTAAAALFACGYFLWSDVDQLRLQVEDLQSKVDQQSKLTKKYQEKADEVIAVEKWLEGRVDWLSELRELSDRLPASDNATVRRLSASSRQGGGEIDLALQVREPENIVELESHLRSARYDVSSKRVSEQTADADFPWGFDTHVEFEGRPSPAKYRELAKAQGPLEKESQPKESQPKESQPRELASKGEQP